MNGHLVEPGQEGQVTVSISRKVRPGHEDDDEAWLQGIVEAETRKATGPGAWFDLPEVPAVKRAPAWKTFF